MKSIRSKRLQCRSQRSAPVVYSTVQYTAQYFARRAERPERKNSATNSNAVHMYE